MSKKRSTVIVKNTKAAKVIWKAIAKHLPHITKEIRLRAVVCSRHGLEPTPENLDWADEQLRYLEE